MTKKDLSVGDYIMIDAAPDEVHIGLIAQDDNNKPYVAVLSPLGHYTAPFNKNNPRHRLLKNTDNLDGRIYGWAIGLELDANSTEDVTLNNLKANFYYNVLVDKFSAFSEGLINKTDLFVVPPDTSSQNYIVEANCISPEGVIEVGRFVYSFSRELASSEVAERYLRRFVFKGEPVVDFKVTPVVDEDLLNLYSENKTPVMLTKGISFITDRYLSNNKKK